MKFKNLVEQAQAQGWKYKNSQSLDVLDGDCSRPPFELPPRLIAHYSDGYAHNVNVADVFCDKTFWQALGRAFDWYDDAELIPKSWLTYSVSCFEIYMRKGLKESLAYLNSLIPTKS